MSGPATVRDVMSPIVFTIKMDATIDQVLSMLLRHHVSGVPVVDAQGRLRGVVSERDLLNLFDSSIDETPTVGDICSTNVLTARPADPLERAVELFRSLPIRRLPVVDDDQKVVGVISRRDLIRVLRDRRLAKIQGLPTEFAAL